MPYENITCECGNEVELFVSQAEESSDRRDCPDCPRIIQYESPPKEGVTDVSFVYEVGTVREHDN
jgi:hypothetical protein